jgi:hypothetical protein
MCLPKINGGEIVLDLAAQKKVLLMCWIWLLDSDADSSWYLILSTHLEMTSQDLMQFSGNLLPQ